MQYSMSGIAPPKEYRPRRRCSELCTDGAHGGRSDGESETEYYEQKVAQGILNGTLIVKDVVYLEQGVPKREASAVTLLAPWMGILVNIDNSRKNLAGLLKKSRKNSRYGAATVLLPRSLRWVVEKKLA
jgi:hypothetical protein